MLPLRERLRALGDELKSMRHGEGRKLYAVCAGAGLSMARGLSIEAGAADGVANEIISERELERYVRACGKDPGRWLARLRVVLTQ